MITRNFSELEPPKLIFCISYENDTVLKNVSKIAFLLRLQFLLLIGYHNDLYSFLTNLLLLKATHTSTKLFELKAT